MRSIVRCSWIILLLLVACSSALAQWERFHGNSMNTGVVPGSQGRPGYLSELWTFDILGYSNSSPALADLDGDGLLEVVFGSWHEALFALNGEDGSILWSYPITLSGNSGAPIIADIDNDQKPEVVFASNDTLYAFEGESGILIWSQKLGPSGIGAGPCAADLDGDGTIEVVFGEHNLTRSFDGETGSVIWTASGYKIFSYGTSVAEDVNGDGAAEVMVFKRNAGLPYFCVLSGIDGEEIWSSQLETGLGATQTPSPGFADINLDGNMEIVSCFGDNDLYVYNSVDGAVVWNKELPHIDIYASPVIADVDGNDTLEIIVTSYSGQEMYCYSCTGDLIWTSEVMGKPLATAAIFDIDDDSELEIIQPSVNTDVICGYLQIFNAQTGVEEYYEYYDGMLGASPAVGDLNGDGFYDIVFGSNNEEIYAITIPGQGIESAENRNNLNLSVDRNPFVNEATISFEIKSQSFTEVIILDLCGREVSSICKETLSAGSHTFSWDTKSQSGVSVASGLYLCIVKSADHVESIGLCLLR